jgi:hypothetical protein
MKGETPELVRHAVLAPKAFVFFLYVLNGSCVISRPIAGGKFSHSEFLDKASRFQSRSFQFVKRVAPGPMRWMSRYERQRGYDVSSGTIADADNEANSRAAYVGAIGLDTSI